MHDLLAGFPVVIEIPVAWGEMDAFGHVNNIVYFRYFESGRIAYFMHLQLPEFLNQSGVGPILASVNCRYKFPLTFPDTISVGTRVDNMDDDRLTMLHRIVSQRHQRIAAEGSGVVVTYDYRTNTKASIPEPVRARIAQLEPHTQVPPR